MLKRLYEYVRANDLVSKNDRVLLAVSGGIDSVVMAELFHRAGFHFGIAHCNFGLRGKESDEDERFVESLAKKYHVTCFVKNFLTTEDAKERRVSVQMAARDLRYEWFEKVRSEEGYDLVATGHHLDDQIETFFINLLRGTGIPGLHGILPRNGYVIRPLLFASRDEIGEFVRENQLVYREDSSNTSKKYLRNRIRLELIPLLREMNPEFIPIMSDNITRIREAVEIYRQKIGEVRKSIVKKRERRVILSVDELKSLKPELTWIYELLAPFGFNESMAADMTTALRHQERKEFVTDEWKAVKDRKEIILTQRTRSSKTGSEEEAKEYQITRGQKTVIRPLKMSITEVTYNPGTEIPAGREYASLDFDKLEFPLFLQRWKPGDAFVPFGMTQKKKISDFFINAKISAEDKQNAWILWSGKKIAWVVGHRPDNRFRVTSRTRTILRMHLVGRGATV
jgi:tRNA(Ile)-lysidine synthase